MVNLINSLDISASGMNAQSERLKIISQNIANSDSAPTTPGGVPYQRKTITFKNVLDKVMGVEKVEVAKIGADKSDFVKKYEPSHPGADADGYVLYPNVNNMIEMADMREAKNAYQANISAIEIAKSMIQRTLELLRA